MPYPLGRRPIKHLQSPFICTTLRLNRRSQCYNGPSSSIRRMFTTILAIVGPLINFVGDFEWSMRFFVIASLSVVLDDRFDLICSYHERNLFAEINLLSSCGCLVWIVSSSNLEPFVPKTNVSSHLTITSSKPNIGSIIILVQQTNRLHKMAMVLQARMQEWVVF
jgi:hypothetical protein